MPKQETTRPAPESASPRPSAEAIRAAFGGLQTNDDEVVAEPVFDEAARKLGLDPDDDGLITVLVRAGWQHIAEIGYQPPHRAVDRPGDRDHG